MRILLFNAISLLQQETCFEHIEDFEIYLYQELGVDETELAELSEIAEDFI